MSQQKPFFDKEANKEAAGETAVAILKVGAAGLGLLATSSPGAVAILGTSLTAELLGNVLPNLKRQRVEKLLNAFAMEMSDLSAEIEEMRGLFLMPEFLDLVEDAATQAAKSVTDTRIEELAKLLKNSISSENADYLVSKRLLSILSELNDIEVHILRCYGTRCSWSVEFAKDNPSFWNRDKEAVYLSFEQHLVDNGLIGPDSHRIDDLALTPIGKMLLGKMGYELHPHADQGKVAGHRFQVEREQAHLMDAIYPRG